MANKSPLRILAESISAATGVKPKSVMRRFQAERAAKLSTKTTAEIKTAATKTRLPENDLLYVEQRTKISVTPKLKRSPAAGSGSSPAKKKTVYKYKIFNHRCDSDSRKIIFEQGKYSSLEDATDISEAILNGNIDFGEQPYIIEIYIYEYAPGSSIALLRRAKKADIDKRKKRNVKPENLRKAIKVKDEVPESGIWQVMYTFCEPEYYKSAGYKDRKLNNELTPAEMEEDEEEIEFYQFIRKENKGSFPVEFWETLEMRGG